MASKKKIVKAVEQALMEVAEAFGMELEELLETYVAAVEAEAEKEEKKAKKAKKSKKAKKAEAENESPPSFEKGDAVKVKIDGKWKKGEVKKVLKTKVRVKTKDGIVSVPFADVKPV